MSPPVPHSLSLFRGQSHAGIGEGPGRPIVAGEQYLAADPRLAGDAELLSVLRSWMTLDAEPSDHRELGESLEAWSCLIAAGFTWVVRLGTAGIFDRRAAYFAHGRAWATATLPSGVDPGVLLGCSGAFERSWQDGERGESVLESPLDRVRIEPIAAEPDAAVRLLATLYHALTSRRVVLVAVPVAEFVAAGPLSALIAFARAALPPALRAQVRVRVFTRQPAAFLRLGANLLVVPEDVAGQALACAKGALLLDRGARPHAGATPPPDARSYAETVTELAIARPEALLPFVERFAPRDGSLPSPRHLLALGLASLPERLGPADESGQVMAVREIDQRMSADPKATAEGLTASGWWPWWRSRTTLAPAALRAAALAWLAAPCWQTAEVQAETLDVGLEDWSQVLADLEPTGLSREDVAALWAGGKRRWPLVPPFELGQLEDLARLARGLEAQRELAEVADRDSSFRGLVEGSLRSHLLPRLPQLAAAQPPPPPPKPEGTEPARDLLAELALLFTRELRGGREWATLVSDLETHLSSAPAGLPSVRARVLLALLWRARHLLTDDEGKALAEALRRKSALGRGLRSIPIQRGTLPMHERVTLFYPRERDTPEPRLVEALLDGCPAEALVWTHQTPKARSVQAFFKGRGHAGPPSLGELESELVAAGGGLVVAGIVEPSAEATLRITVLSPRGLEPAESLLVLRPGLPPERRRLANGPLLLARGEHLVIPVDREAELQLGKLQEVLSCLPREVSGLILETITQPSLDYRLSVLEERGGVIPTKPSRPGAAMATTPGNRLRRFLASPVPAGRVIAGLAWALGIAYAAWALAAPVTSFLTASERRIEAVETAVKEVLQRPQAHPTLTPTPNPPAANPDKKAPATDPKPPASPKKPQGTTKKPVQPTGSPP